ncbi:TPA: ABC transporter substrate-binding protein [Streptococcus suis]
MKHYKKLLLMGMAALTLGACVPTQTSPGGTNTTINIGYSQLPANIHPAEDYNGWFTVRYGVGETLFKLNNDLQVEPWLAEKIESVSDVEWKITLKDNITFQNGEKMTGQKVKESLEYLISKSDRAKADLGIASISADGQTVIIKTEQRQPIMANLLAEPYSVIIDVAAEPIAKQGPVATGPYKLMKYIPESGVELEAYEGYWAGKPKTTNINIKYFTDATAIAAALKSGEVDAVYGLPYANLETFKSDSNNFKTSEVEGSRYVQFSYNLEQPEGQDKTFRQALDSLVDKETYTSSLFKGAAKVADTAFPNNFEFALGTSVHEYNVEKAVQLLDEAGYKDTNGDGLREANGQNIKLDLITYNRLAEMPLSVQAYQQQLKEVGIDSEVITVDKPTTAVSENKYDVLTYTVVAAPIGDPYAYYKSVFYTNGSANIAHYSNPAVDSLIDQLQVEADQAKRNELSKQIQKLVDEDYIFTYIGHFKVALVMNNNIQGFESHATDYYHVTNQIVKE